MKIGIYIGSRGGAYGGAENTVAVLASALQKHHPVEILSSAERFDIDQLASASGTDLRGVRARFIPFENEPVAPSANLLRSSREAREWNAALSRDCDLFINIANVAPPFSHAAHAVLRIFFPWGGVKKPTASLRHPRTWLRQNFRRLQWLQRLRSYGFRVANSQFTQKWTRELWGVDCSVIHPPVDTSFTDTEKGNLIASVGRFSLSGNAKKQLELTRAFAGMAPLHAKGWEYYTVGGLLDDPGDQAYFAEVTRAGSEAPAHVLANLKRAELKQLLERSKIFWHAAGLGENEETNPGSAEHFGQSTVEAMAAGCVPVVINRGGQPEIVEHGISGFIWNTLEEMEEYTRRLAADEGLRSQMAAAARERSTRFNRAAFSESFLKLLAPVLH